jgi:chaperonin GroES
MIQSNVKPLANRIVVRRNELKVSKGGILLPEAAQEKPRQGKVVAVGPGKTDDLGNLIPVDVRIGDEVLFSSYSGTEYQDEFLILSEDDVLAVFVS